MLKSGIRQFRECILSTDILDSEWKEECISFTNKFLLLLCIYMILGKRIIERLSCVGVFNQVVSSSKSDIVNTFKRSFFVIYPFI